MPEYLKEDHECCVCLSTGLGRKEVEKQNRNTAICFGCIDKYMTNGLCSGMAQSVFSPYSHDGDEDYFRQKRICAMCQQKKMALLALPVCQSCQEFANHAASTVADSDSDSDSDSGSDSDSDSDSDWDYV